MVKESKATKESEEDNPILVVKELPTQIVRTGIDSEDGEKEYNLMTIEEALTESLRILKRLDKAL